MEARAQNLCHCAIQATPLRGGAYHFEARDRTSNNPVVLGDLHYDNPWIAIDCAVRCGDWILCLERTQGSMALGGFRHNTHYTFRHLDRLELCRPACLYSEWVTALTRYLLGYESALPAFELTQ